MNHPNLPKSKFILKVKAFKTSENVESSHSQFPHSTMDKSKTRSFQYSDSSENLNSPNDDVVKRKTVAKTKNRIQTQNEAEDIGIWLVEDVVKKRVRKGLVEYFVKWKDFPSSQNTWEPVKHLISCPKLIEEFENRKKKKSRPNSFQPAQNNNMSLQYESMRAEVSISGRTSPGIPLLAPIPIPIPESSTAAVDVVDSQIQNADLNPISGSRSSGTGTVVTYEFDWAQHPVKAVIGVDRIKTSGELFYKVAWDRVEPDISGGGDRIVTEWDLVPAAIAREKVPHLVIEFLGTIISWIASTPGNSPCPSLNNSFSEAPSPTAETEGVLNSSGSDPDHQNDDEGEQVGRDSDVQMEAESIQNIPAAESLIHLDSTLTDTDEVLKNNEVEENDESMLVTSHSDAEAEGTDEAGTIGNNNTDPDIGITLSV